MDALLTSDTPPIRHATVYHAAQVSATVLHESYQTIDEQREEVMGAISPAYTPLDLAVPWILEKAAEVERAQSNIADAEVRAG